MKKWDELYNANMELLDTNGVKIDRMDRVFVCGEMTIKDMEIQYLKMRLDLHESVKVEAMEVAQ